MFYCRPSLSLHCRIQRRWHGNQKMQKTIPSSRRARRKEAQRGRVRKQKSQSSKINEALFYITFLCFLLHTSNFELNWASSMSLFFFIFCNLMWMWENFFPKKTWNIYQNTILSHLIASRLLCWLTGQSFSSCTTLILISRILRLRVEAKKRDSLNSSHRSRRLFAAALERIFMCARLSLSNINSTIVCEKLINSIQNIFFFFDRRWEERQKRWEKNPRINGRFCVRLSLPPFFRSFFDEIVLSYPQLLMLRAAAPSHIVIARRIDLMMGTKKTLHIIYSFRRLI